MKLPLAILIVEDSEDDAELIVLEVKRGNYEPRWQRVDTKKDMMSALKRESWDLIIADYALPQFSGLEALKLLKENEIDLPFILVSGTIGEEIAVDAMKAGAHDYIMKGNLKRLVPAIEREMREAGIRAEHRKTELALKESEQRFRSLFENMREASLTSDQDGNILSANPAAASILGFREAELMKGIPTRNLFEMSDNQENIMGEVRDKGYSENFEATLVKQDGSEERVHILGSAILTKAADSETMCIESIFTDISEKKRLEEQLLQAQKMEAVGRLAGGIAHDFNNLLTVIMGNAEFGLQTTQPNEPVYEELLRVQRAARQATELTSQLLTFSRRQVLKPEIIDLNSCVNNHIKLLRRIIGEDIDLISELASESLTVFADPGQIQQVLMNLSVNARDAMPKGGKLCIKTSLAVLDRNFLWYSQPFNTQSQVSLHEEPYVEICIRDNGCGMDATTLKHIFEPFFTTKDIGKGTGLGLAMVYGIIRQHNGLIDVKSDVGRGTSFRIFLPTHANANGTRSGDPSELPVPRGTETILVIEDEEAVRHVTTRILASLGYRVIDTADGRQALEICQKEKDNIDLVILDVVMPEISGPDTYRNLQKINPHLPVIFVTGYDADSELTGLAAIDRNSPQLLYKPYTSEDLGKKIREVLDDPAKPAVI